MVGLSTVFLTQLYCVMGSDFFYVGRVVAGKAYQAISVGGFGMKIKMDGALWDFQDHGAQKLYLVFVMMDGELQFGKMELITSRVS